MRRWRSRTGPTDPGAGVTATGLGKRFGDLWALRDLDLDVAPGTVLGLLGHNGAGKTTAIRILTTLSTPTEGRRRVAGYRRRRATRTRCGDASASPRSRRRVDGLMSARKNLVMVGRLHHLSKRGRRAARRRAARAPRPRRRGDRAREDVLRRHAPPPRPRREPGRRARGAVPRRADHRPRPAQPRRPLGDAARRSSATAPRSSSPRSTSRRPTSSPTTIIVLDHGRTVAHGTPAELKAQHRHGSHRRRRSGHAADLHAVGQRDASSSRRTPTSSTTTASSPPIPVVRRHPARWKSCARSTPPASTPSTSTAARRRSTTCSSPSPARPASMPTTTEEVPA